MDKDMMRSEFDNLAKRPCTDSEYKVIETVYNWYPGIETKQDIATLWDNFGMIIINDMLKTAMKVRDLDNERRSLETRIKAIDLEYKTLTFGN